MFIILFTIYAFLEKLAYTSKKEKRPMLSDIKCHYKRIYCSDALFKKHVTLC